MSEKKAEVGFGFDLSAWRSGLQRAGKMAETMLSSGVNAGLKKVSSAVRATFGKIRDFIKGVLNSALAPLIGLFAVAKIIGTIRTALTGSLAAYRQYSDSVTTLQASLKTLGAGVDMTGAVASVRQLGEQLRLAMGITGTEVNAAFATFVTRGFDMAQARQLTILAANYAKKSGKPIADVTKQIADAANGSVDAMKELGVQVTASGNRVKDAEAAVLALKAAYGDIGADLANPSERLAAAWNMLAVSLGEKISPVIEPLVQGFSDFVVGLTQTEQGQQMLDKIAETLRFVVDWIKQAIINVSNLVEMVKSGGGVIVGFLKKIINDFMRHLLDRLRELPGSDWVLEKMGLDGEKLSAALQDNSREAMEQARQASSDFMRAQGEFLRGESDTGVAGQFSSLIEAGRKAREEAAASLQRESQLTAGIGFAGRVAQETEAAKAAKAQAAQEQATAKQREAALKGMNTRMSGRADAQAGQRVSVRIVSTRPDRFRKARAR